MNNNNYGAFMLDDGLGEAEFILDEIGDMDDLEDDPDDDMGDMEDDLDEYGRPRRRRRRRRRSRAGRRRRFGRRSRRARKVAGKGRERKALRILRRNFRMLKRAIKRTQDPARKAKLYRLMFVNVNRRLTLLHKWQPKTSAGKNRRAKKQQLLLALKTKLQQSMSSTPSFRPGMRRAKMQAKLMQLQQGQQVVEASNEGVQHIMPSNIEQQEELQAEGLAPFQPGMPPGVRQHPSLTKPLFTPVPSPGSASRWMPSSNADDEWDESEDMEGLGGDYFEYSDPYMEEEALEELDGLENFMNLPVLLKERNTGAIAFTAGGIGYIYSMTAGKKGKAKKHNNLVMAASGIALLFGTYSIFTGTGTES